MSDSSRKRIGLATIASRRTEPTGYQRLAADVFKLAIADALTGTNPRRRDDAREFLTRPRYHIREFWAAVLNVPDDVMVEYARAVIAEHDDALVGRQDGETVACGA